MFKKKIVEVYATRMYCDECKVEMVFEGRIMYSEHDRYSYSCPSCKKKEIITEKYPKIEYIERISFLDKLKGKF